MNKEKQVILFDGVCNFCNFWVNFVIRRDKNDLFRFVALQSERAKELTIRLNIKASTFNTLFLIVGEKSYIKSTAALMICKKLSGPIVILSSLIIFPRYFRDFVYDIIAKNRYKMFGRKENCRIPTEAEKVKFLL